MIECSIKDFHDFIKTRNLDLLDNVVNVDTPKGKYRILGVDITARNSKYSGIILDREYHLLGHQKHLVFKVGEGWTPMKNINVGDLVLTKDGEIPVQLRSNYSDMIDLYDIQVDQVEQYYSNGIVSHNSTLSDVIKLGFYGKTKDKPLSRIPNRFNKYGEINLSFNIGGKDINIKRMFEPSSFDLKEGKKPVDISSKPELQKYLEDTYLKMPYHIFDNMVSLSLNDFKSFLKMKAEDKRKIIDQVFSMAVVNDMRKEIKSKSLDTQKDIDKKQSNLNYIDSVINKTQQEILSLNESLSQKKEDKTQELKVDLENIQSKKDNLTINLKKIKDKLDTGNSKLRVLKSELSDLNYKQRDIKDDLSLYDDGVCPTCGSDLTTDTHGDNRKYLEKKLTEVEESIKILKDKITDSQSKVDVIDDKFYNITDKINDLKRKEYKIISEINEQTSEIDVDGQTESLKRILDDNINKKDLLDIDIAKLLKKVKFYKQAEGILSEDGVKKTIISTIVPELNNNINNYLEMFDLTFKVEFNNKFESTITEHGEFVGTGDISLGESKIFDFCVLISLVRILKSKYYNLNVLFLDEIFASLDSDNIIHVLKILKNFSTEYKLNVFVINHGPLPKEYFDNLIQINKDRFSNLKYVEDF